jgi:hypothetical protein
MLHKNALGLTAHLIFSTWGLSSGKLSNTFPSIKTISAYGNILLLFTTARNP